MISISKHPLFFYMLWENGIYVSIKFAGNKTNG